LALARPEVREEFYTLMERLSENSADPTFGRAPVMDAPATFAVLFDSALVTFQDLADYPVVWIGKLTPLL
jgi:hypothetical protein